MKHSTRKNKRNVLCTLNGMHFTTMHFLWGRILFFCICLTLSQSYTLAQWTGEQSMFYQQYDLKHYAITPIETKDNYFMAGTVFNYHDASSPFTSNAVHWIYTDNLGNPIISKVLDAPDFDENVIGAHIFNGNGVIIAGRMNASSESAIEIITVDGVTGSLFAGDIITADPSSPYRNLYPLGSLKYTDRDLFICGYATNTPNGILPDLTTTKAAFVLKYDILTGAVIDAHYFKSSTNGPYDFDMATRMKAVSSGIWVGGSINDGPMMNRIIDPITLNDINVEHFGRTTSMAQYESSFDIMETPNGDMFVFGNTFTIDANVTPPFDISPRPNWVHINAVDRNLRPYPGNSRWQFSGFDYAWGINILKDNNGDDNTFVLSGFESNRSCNRMPITNTDNINPFLAKMVVKMEPTGIKVVPYFWNSLLSIQGTGSSSNSYYRLGDYISNLAWGPISTVRDLSVTSDIVLTCPVWNSSNYLNIKFIRTDENAELKDCEWERACSTKSVLLSTRRSGGSSNNAFPVLEQPYIFNDFYFPAQYIDDCSGHYKMTDVAMNDHPDLVSIYPNPASTEIHIRWRADSDSQIASLSIIDILGKTIMKLDVKQANGINDATINVENLIPGLYHYFLNTCDTKVSGTFAKE